MFAAILAGATLLVAPRIVRSQAPLIGGHGGAAGYGTQCLSPNDDGSSAAIDVRPAFPSGLHFFSGTYTRLFVNTNGNVTFNGPLSTFTPRAFPVASQPMIAPYWADVDIRPDGCGGLGAGTSATGSGPCRNPGENGVWWHLEPGRMIVTWDRVGYFSCQLNHRMSFQLVLTDASQCGGDGNFDVEFRYNRCEWTTGGASGGTGGFGGTPAQAGFDAGDNSHFFSIPGSLMPNVHQRLCGGTNINQRGVFRFAIRSGTITDDGGVSCLPDGFDYDASDAPTYDVCLDRPCLLLKGRAGPWGNCTCRVPGRGPGRGRALALVAVVGIVISGMRRLRHRRPRRTP